MSERTGPVEPRAQLRFVFLYCNEIASMRAFYGAGLGLKEKYHVDNEQAGWLSFDCGGSELVIARAGAPLPVSDRYSFMPGDGQGDDCRTALGVQVPTGDYRAAVARIRGSGFRSQSPTPTWRQGSYWGWTVLDPMGNTVEVYCHLADVGDGSDRPWPEGLE